MAKERESITIDPKVNKLIHQEAKRNKRSFSSMVEIILYNHLEEESLI